MKTVTYCHSWVYLDYSMIYRQVKLCSQVNKTAAYYARNDDIKTLLFTPRESLPVGETKQAAPVRDGTRLFDSPLPVDNPSNQRASQLFTFPTMEREPTLDVMPPASKPVIMGTKDTPRITRKNLNQWKLQGNNPSRKVNNVCLNSLYQEYLCVYKIINKDN